MTVACIDPAVLRQARAMSEAQLQRQVRGICDSLGLAVQHVGNAKRSWLPGWPDLVIIGSEGVLYAELKSEFGDLDSEQRQVRNKLLVAAQEYRLWRPRDLLAGIITTELVEVSGRDFARG